MIFLRSFKNVAPPPGSRDRGPANAIDLSPNGVCVCGTWSFALSTDLNAGRRSTLSSVSSTSIYPEDAITSL